MNLFFDDLQIQNLDIKKSITNQNNIVKVIKRNTLYLLLDKVLYQSFITTKDCISKKMQQNLIMKFVKFVKNIDTQ